MTNGEHGSRSEAKATAKDRLLQSIAILGLIAILLLGAWGIIQLAFNLPGVFSNVGSSLTSLFTSRTATSTKEVLTVTAPQSITHNQPFTLTWRHQGGTGAYSYTLSYSCDENVTLKAPLPNGSYEAVECNKPFNFTSAKDKMTLVPSVTKASRVTFTVAATRLSSSKVVVSGTASANAAAAKTATTPKPSTSGTTGGTYYGSGRTSNLYGTPDLAVSINSVHSLSSFYGRTAVVFTIQNVGTNVALAGWNFTARLPLGNNYVYPSAPQQPLYPGDRIVYTMTFDGGNYYSYENNYYGGSLQGGYFADTYSNYNSSYRPGSIVITADPYNQVLEMNESNNTAAY